MRKPVPESNENRIPYWPGAASMICLSCGSVNQRCLGRGGFLRLSSQAIQILRPSTSFRMPTTMAIVLRLRLDHLAAGFLELKRLARKISDELLHLSFGHAAHGQVTEPEQDVLGEMRLHGLNGSC